MSIANEVYWRRARRTAVAVGVTAAVLFGVAPSLLWSICGYAYVAAVAGALVFLAACALHAFVE